MAETQSKKVIIALMGLTGTGKSSFINLVIGREVAKVAHGLQSGTFLFIPNNKNKTLTMNQALQLFQHIHSHTASMISHWSIHQDLTIRVSQIEKFCIV
jgi:ABC-type molybdate transport system ATPase subunit